MANVIDIHVRRGQAGRLVPFDKVYLFRREDEALIPKIFGFALVMPLSRELAEGLFVLRPATLTHKFPYRKDDTKNLTIYHEPSGEPLATAKISHADAKEWWLAFEAAHDLKNRVVVVPVLTSLVRRKLRPRYLTAERSLRERHKALGPKHLKVLGNGITDFAYLATPHPAPNDKIQPLCWMCPRQLLRLQGDCTPGQLICYKSLDFATLAEDENAGVSTDDDLDH